MSVFFENLAHTADLAFNRTPQNRLYEAVMDSKKQLVRQILENKPNLNNAAIRMNILTLYHPITKKDSEMLNLLINAGMPLEQKDDENYNALYYAIIYNNIEAVNLLLSNGANPSARVGKKELPLLIYAVSSNIQPEILELLLLAGAKIEAKSASGLNALVNAVINKNFEAVKVLIKYGTDVNTRYSDNRTPIFDAVLINNYTITKLLIEAGADINIVNDNGHTIFDFKDDCKPKLREYLNQLSN